MPRTTTQVFRAVTPGQLPAEAGAVVGGVRLPPGKLVVPDSFTSGLKAEPSAPRLWTTARPVSSATDLVEALAAHFPTTGLWPLVLESLRGADDRPWLSGELDPAPHAEATGYEPSVVLADWWEACVPDEDEEPDAFDALVPFGREFPGLAQVRNPAWSRVPVREVAASLSGRVGLVPVSRPADAVAAIGWQGPVNHFSDMGALASVLRSWEARFGAFLVGVGFDTLTLAVGAPPSTPSAARAIAAEHFAACPDIVYQGSGSIDAYAQTLVGVESWQFWWD